VWREDVALAVLFANLESAGIFHDFVQFHLLPSFFNSEMEIVGVLHCHRLKTRASKSLTTLLGLIDFAVGIFPSFTITLLGIST
jgi:hypothetical protein